MKFWRADDYHLKLNVQYVDGFSGGYGWPPPKKGTERWSDDLPWYFDEKPVPAKFKDRYNKNNQLNEDLFDAKGEPTTFNKASQLWYSDVPNLQPGLQADYKTWVVGIDNKGRPYFLGGFTWQWSSNKAGKQAFKPGKRIGPATKADYEDLLKEQKFPENARITST